MPASDDHLTQAWHNYSLLGFFSQHKVDGHYSDWFVTAAFYCAVHFVEAFLYIKGSFVVDVFGTKDIHHSTDAENFYTVKSPHHLRMRLIRDNPPYFRDIEWDYRSLYEMSRVARYNCENPQNHDFIEAGVRLEAIKVWAENRMPAPRPAQPREVP